MLKLLIALALGSGVAVPAVHVLASPGTAAAQQQLLHQINSGPAGEVTHLVVCTPRRGGSLACTLHGSHRGGLGAQLVVHGGSTETVWAPIHG